jgi:hypothetical protein
MNIRETITIVLLASSLAGCGVVDLISKGMSYSNAVAADLDREIGLKPEVGFNWHNGNLQSVTVTFPKIYVGTPLDELAGTVREVVVRQQRLGLPIPQIARGRGRPGLKLRDPGVVFSCELQ